MVKKNNKLTLEQLDAYARTISAKQVNMLYENRMKKKYTASKSLNESTIAPDPEEYFVAFVSNDAMVQNSDNNIMLTYAVCANKPNVKHVIETAEGVYFYTELPADYEYIVRKLVELGYGEFIKDNIDPDYRYIIEDSEK